MHTDIHTYIYNTFFLLKRTQRSYKVTKGDNKISQDNKNQDRRTQ